MDFLIVSLPTGQQFPAPSAELIGCARSLTSNLGGTVSVLILGKGITDAGREAVAYGADQVYCTDHEALTDFNADAYLQAMETGLGQIKADAVLFTADPFATELAPRLAGRLGTGVVTECAEVKATPEGRLTFVRPVYGGKAVAEMEVTGSPQIATVTPRSFEPLAPDASRQADISAIAVQIDASRVKTRVLEVQPEQVAGVRLEDANIVVAGGRGLGEAANFRYLEELAQVIGAAVGSSRPPVDSGWVSPSMQIGQTGKSVAPDLYVAVGISGSSQHQAGMSRAKHVVVINKDPEAPFFRIAELGVVADYKKLLPLLTQKLQALSGK